METAERTTAPPRPFLWTKSPYHELGDMGWFQDERVELVDGEIIQISRTSAPH